MAYPDMTSLGKVPEIARGLLLKTMEARVTGRTLDLNTWNNNLTNGYNYFLKHHCALADFLEQRCQQLLSTLMQNRNQLVQTRGMIDPLVEQAVDVLTGKYPGAQATCLSDIAHCTSALVPRASAAIFQVRGSLDKLYLALEEIVRDPFFVDWLLLCAVHPFPQNEDKNNAAWSGLLATTKGGIAPPFWRIGRGCFQIQNIIVGEELKYFTLLRCAVHAFHNLIEIMFMGTPLGADFFGNIEERLTNSKMPLNASAKALLIRVCRESHLEISLLFIPLLLSGLEGAQQYLLHHSTINEVNAQYFFALTKELPDLLPEVASFFK